MASRSERRLPAELSYSTRRITDEDRRLGRRWVVHDRDAWPVTRSAAATTSMTLDPVPLPILYRRVVPCGGPCFRAATNASAASSTCRWSRTTLPSPFTTKLAVSSAATARTRGTIRVGSGSARPAALNSRSTAADSRPCPASHPTAASAASLLDAYGCGGRPAAPRTSAAEPANRRSSWWRRTRVARPRPSPLPAAARSSRRRSP